MISKLSALLEYLDLLQKNLSKKFYMILDMKFSKLRYILSMVQCMYSVICQVIGANDKGTI